MGVPMQALERKPNLTNIVYEVDSAWAVKSAGMIRKFLGNDGHKTKLFQDGSTDGFAKPGYNPNGQYLEKENFNLVIVSEQPFGGFNLMAPCMMDCVTQYLMRDNLFQPERIAIVAEPELLKLNQTMGSPKFKFFSTEDLQELKNFLGI